jgi:O-glycosyl hydrolase
MTKQKYVLGRDVDPAEKYEMAEYMASWAMYLIEKEKVNVKYFSLHNEGDAYYRWPRDGSNPGEDHRDYNLYWPAEQVVDFLKVTREVFDHHGLKNVLLTPGETQTWYRFDKWGYASAIVNDSEALKSLGLITSHSFTVTDQINSVYYGDFRSVGQDLIREKKPAIHTWCTSRPWGKGPQFIDNITRDIYECKVNGLIPWALISGAGEWLTSNGFTDGSMEVAFLINRDGSFKVLDGYYYYKQVTRAGQPGMHVTQVESYDPAISVLAFSGRNTKHKDAFVLVNKSDIAKNVSLTLKGSDNTRWAIFRTSDTEKYSPLQPLESANGMLEYACPPNSVTTFFGE